MHDGKYIQSISIRNAQGQEKLIYFDMTDIYGKLGKSRDKKTRKDIKRSVAYTHLTLVGTDSHTTMINGIGVVGWGVGLSLIHI